MSIDGSKTKDYNHSRIFNLLRKHSRLSRNEIIAEATSLTVHLDSADHLLDLDAISLGTQLSLKILAYLQHNIQMPLYVCSKPYRYQLVFGQTGEHSAALGAATLPLYDTFVEPARFHLEPIFSSSQGGDRHII